MRSVFRGKSPRHRSLRRTPRGGTDAALGGAMNFGGMMTYTTALGLLLLLSAAPVHGQEQTSKEASLSALEERLQTLLQQVRAEARLERIGQIQRGDSAGDSDRSPGGKIEELDQKVRILERQLEIEQEQAKERAAQTPTVGASREGFQFRSGDGNFLLRVRGYFQADGIFVANEGTDVGTSTFLMRRVRPVFEATMFKRFDFKVMPDFGLGTTVLQDGYLDARFTPFVQRAGGQVQIALRPRAAGLRDGPSVRRAGPSHRPRPEPRRRLDAPWRSREIPHRLSGRSFQRRRRRRERGPGQRRREGLRRTRHDPSFPRRSEAERLQGLGVGLAASIGTQEGTLTAPNLPNLQTAEPPFLLPVPRRRHRCRHHGCGRRPPPDLAAGLLLLGPASVFSGSTSGLSRT